MSVIKNLGLLVAFTVLAGLIALGMMLLALWIAIHMVAPLPVDANTDVLTGSSSLRVQSADPNKLQPFGKAYEDETTAAMVVQPALNANSLQTMEHYKSIQFGEDRSPRTFNPQQFDNLSIQ